VAAKLVTNVLRRLKLELARPPRIELGLRVPERRSEISNVANY